MTYQRNDTPEPLASEEELPSGFTCECGKFHEFGVYVAAHADIRLTHTCDACGAKHSVLRYKVRLLK